MSDAEEGVGADPPPGEARTTRPARSSRRQLRPASEWEGLDDEALLDLRLCDLDLRIEGTWLEPLIEELYSELAERGLAFRPHFWLSDDWFCPDGVPGVAIPFYLAHPRLTKLEQSQMLEVEGGTPEWCLRILRHETGHALENAYHLKRRRRRQRLFGVSSVPYPEFYTPRPYSKSYVVHLDSWYGQSHPDEDFAETFAVCLTPGSDWRKRYASWKFALKKLEYVEALIQELAGKPPLVRSRARVDPISQLRKTLRTYYERRGQHYGVEDPEVYDRDLRRLFSGKPEFATNPTAASFISRVRKEVRRLVRRWTGEYQYTIDQVLGDVISRSRELNLRLTRPEEQTKQEFIIMLTVQTMNYLHSGRHRLAL